MNTPTCMRKVDNGEEKKREKRKKQDLSRKCSAWKDLKKILGLPKVVQKKFGWKCFWF